MTKVKDLNKYLTQKTGLNAAEREAWRNKVSSLSAEGNKAEALRVFQSFTYWKQNYYSDLNK